MASGSLCGLTGGMSARTLWGRFALRWRPVARGPGRRRRWRSRRGACRRPCSGWRPPTSIRHRRRWRRDRRCRRRRCRRTPGHRAGGWTPALHHRTLRRGRVRQRDAHPGEDVLVKPEQSKRVGAGAAVHVVGTGAAPAATCRACAAEALRALDAAGRRGEGPRLRRPRLRALRRAALGSGLASGLALGGRAGLGLREVGLALLLGRGDRVLQGVLPGGAGEIRRALGDRGDRTCCPRLGRDGGGVGG